MDDRTADRSPPIYRSWFMPTTAGRPAIFHLRGTWLRPLPTLFNSPTRSNVGNHAHIKTIGTSLARHSPICSIRTRSRPARILTLASQDLLPALRPRRHYAAGDIIGRTTTCTVPSRRSCMLVRFPVSASDWMRNDASANGWPSSCQTAKSFFI